MPTPSKSTHSTTPATTPVDGIIVIRAIELLLDKAASSLNNTLAKQTCEQREEKRKHHDLILQTPDVSIIQYRKSPELPQGISVGNPNLSKVTEMEVDECPSKNQCYQKIRCGRKLLFERTQSTNIPQTKSRDPVVENVGLKNGVWSETCINEETCNETSKEEVKKTLVQMLKREEGNIRDESTDELIRINRQTYSPVEVQREPEGRSIYTPMQKNANPHISFAAETRSPSGSDNEDRKSKPIEDELIEV